MMYTVYLLFCDSQLKLNVYIIKKVYIVKNVVALQLQNVNILLTWYLNTCLNSVQTKVAYLL